MSLSAISASTCFEFRIELYLNLLAQYRGFCADVCVIGFFNIDFLTLIIGNIVFVDGDSSFFGSYLSSYIIGLIGNALNGVALIFSSLGATAGTGL